MITIQEHPAIIEHLGLVEENDQITHFVTTEKQCDPKDYLSKKYFLCIIKSTLLSSHAFKIDLEYLISEDKYKQIRDGKALYIIPTNLIWFCHL